MLVGMKLLGGQGFDPCGFSGTLRELCTVKIEEDDGCPSDKGSDGGCTKQSAEHGSADFAQILGFFDAGKSAHDRHENQWDDQHLQEADVTVTDDIDPIDGSVIVLSGAKSSWMAAPKITPKASAMKTRFENLTCLAPKR